jgi:hypothetical protein
MDKHEEEGANRGDSEIEMLLAQCYRLTLARNQATRCDNSSKRLDDLCQESDHEKNGGKVGLHPDSFGLESA